jgi:hypothetical protein
MTASTVTATLKAGSATVDGTASYDATSKTVTFTPTAALANATSYTMTVSGSDSSGTAMAAPYSWSFTTVAAAVTCPCSLFPAGAAPTANGIDSGDRSALSIGVKFVPSVAGFISGVRFYKAATNVGTHTGSLWSSTGTQLATGTFADETASGWQSLTFADPIAVTAGSTYVVSYFAPSGHYSEDDQYFASSVSNGPLSAPVSAGLYSYGNDTFPVSTYAKANYWVDPVFTTS